MTGLVEPKPSEEDEDEWESEDEEVRKEAIKSILYSINITPACDLPKDNTCSLVLKEGIIIISNIIANCVDDSP